MPVSDEDREAGRTKWLDHSLEESGVPRWGYFGMTGCLAIGDNSVAPNAQRKPPPADDAEPNRQPQATPAKKGNTPDVYFRFDAPLCVGDPYMDPHLRERRNKVEMVDPEAPMKPAGRPKYTIMGQDGTPYFANKLGYQYMEECMGVKDPKETYEKYKDSDAYAAFFPRNFYTSPSKKCGPGLFPPGTLFGDPENDRKVWANMNEPYDGDRNARRRELDLHHELVAKVSETPFRGKHYGNRAFQNDSEAYHCDIPRGIPKVVEEKDMHTYPHENAFKLGMKLKKGANAYFGYGEPNIYFPEWVPEPPSNVPTRKPVDDNAPPPWRPNHPRQVCNPMPSVVTNMRNMRNERPQSFMRPSLSMPSLRKA